MFVVLNRELMTGLHTLQIYIKVYTTNRRKSSEQITDNGSDLKFEALPVLKTDKTHSVIGV